MYKHNLHGGCAGNIGYCNVILFLSPQFMIYVATQQRYITVFVGKNCDRKKLTKW